MATATINGIEIAYTDQGSGTPVVFIHGFPLNRSMWENQVAGLSGQARVITIDLRGHGESQAPLWFATVDTYADEVAGLLDHLGIDKTVIAGFSMGGYVTFAFWRRHQDKVRGLILADTRPQADSAEAKQGRFNTAQNAHANGAGVVATAMLPRLLTQPSIDGNPSLVGAAKAIMESTPVTGIAADLMSMAERPDSVDLLPSINVPTLVIVGAEDALTPPADSQLMADKVPGAKLVTIPAAAHLSPMEQPAAFNQAVADFLSTLK